MDFNTAVLNAKNGDAAGFEYLRQCTSTDMYYLALKYVNDASEAHYIIDKAYSKAKYNISALNDPSAFKSWLGAIVAGISLEYLKTKKPLIFSAMGGDENNGMSFIYETQDNDQSFTPDRQYSQDDVRFLSKEMLNSLSDEQRMCIVMYHFAGQSIDDIAECLNCSQNTVISRLYYGRNKLRNKIDYLRKKGFYINTDAPIPLLKYILDTEKTLPEIQNCADNASKNRTENRNTEEVQRNTQVSASVEQRIPAEEHRPAEQRIPDVQHSPVQQVSYNDTTEYTSVRPGILVFLSTVTGKITAIMLIAVSIGAAAAGIAVGKNGINGILGIEESSSSDKFKTYSHNRKPTDSETESTYGTVNAELNQWNSLSEDKYPELISGQLSKSQLELVLARLPKNYNYINQFDEEKYIQRFCDDIREKGAEKGFTPPTGNYYSPDFRVDELNMIFKSFGKDDYVIDSSNFTLGDYISGESGDIIVFEPEKNTEQVNAVITNAVYDMKTMNITFINEYYGIDINKVMERKAVLKRDDSGYYKIQTIETLKDNVDRENSLAPKVESAVSKISDVTSEVSSMNNNDSDSDKTSSSEITSSSLASSSATISEYSSANTSSNETYFVESEIIHDNSSIDDSYNDDNNSSPSDDVSFDQTENNIDDLYREVIHQYRLSNEYAYCDIDNDGIEELILRPLNSSNISDYVFYICIKGDQKYDPNILKNEITVTPDVQLRFEKHNGLLVIETDTKKENDRETYYRVVKHGNSVVKEQLTEYQPGEQIEWMPCS